MPQFIACRFSPRGRTYTYRNEGAPVQPGDRVLVPNYAGDDVTVEVVEIVPEPPFETRRIRGLAPAEDATGDAAR